METVTILDTKFRDGNSKKGAWRSISIKVPDGRWMSCFAHGHTDPVLNLQKGDTVTIQTEKDGDYWNFKLAQSVDEGIPPSIVPDIHKAADKDKLTEILTNTRTIITKLEELTAKADADIPF